MIAFGGGGPVHATRVAEKIGIDRVLVPSGAGVGSAIGFLRAPVGYEVVRSLYQRLSRLDIAAVNALLAEMEREAEDVVRQGSFGAPLERGRLGFMRYLGQGHEIAVSLPAHALGPDDAAAIRDAYETAYRRTFDRPVPGSDVEVMSWAVTVATPPRAAPAEAAASGTRESVPVRHQRVRDSATGALADWAVFDRAALSPGSRLAGPAIIAEDETSTLLGAHWHATVDANGYLHLAREATR